MSIYIVSAYRVIFMHSKVIDACFDTLILYDNFGTEITYLYTGMNVAELQNRIVTICSFFIAG